VADPESRSLELGDEVRLAGEESGEGPTAILNHGITATRDQVVHGSRALARSGFHVVAYDARGHGESDPAGKGGYGYPQLVADLEAVARATAGDSPFLLAGSSMGAHTIVAYALERPQRVAGLVVIGPVYAGAVADSKEREAIFARWDALADGLEQGGVEGFLEALDRQGLDPGWRETILGFTRERMLKHRHPEAVAQALREVPRSKPFESMDELEFLDLPALVVASHDVADPGHPFAVAEAYAARIPKARLVSEAEGESPLAWQGGKLSREIAAFAEQPAVAERLRAS
jgi:pimeloyl-ACP methyl ester carboxylesterase